MDDLLKLLKSVCEGNESALQTLLSFFIEKTLTENEISNVHRYLKKSTHPSATYARGLLFEKGYGVEIDLEATFLLMRDAASQGYAPAIYEVGRRFLYGIGVEKNVENALQWLMHAAGSPYYYPQASYLLGMVYRDGIGVEKDEKKALQWFLK